MLIGGTKVPVAGVKDAKPASVGATSAKFQPPSTVGADNAVHVGLSIALHDCVAAEVAVLVDPAGQVAPAPVQRICSQEHISCILVHV